jgi:kynurenine formamidase
MTITDLTDLPAYDDLPIRPDLPAGSSWGIWGEDDTLGCLNLLTSERVAAAAALVSSGKVFALNLDLGLPDPPLFRRAAFTHHVTGEVGKTGHDDVLSNWNTQASSQWDGFRHVRGHAGYYNGVDDEAHGMHHWAARGIAGRGVLADVARWRAAEGRPLAPDDTDPIEPDDLLATLEHQNVTVETGDVLLIRTGWLTWYRTLDETQRTSLASALKAPGLRPGVATARALWDLHVAAVAADNPALEAWPPGALATDEQRARGEQDPAARVELFVHLSLLPLLGIPIGELWDLDALADDCAADGRYAFFLTSAPIHVRSGVASPPNALAIK